MNALAGTRFKIVTGYPGGNDINLAMERGEVGGRGSNSWESWKSTRPQWLRDKLIHVLVQIGLKRHPELPDVPLMLELGRTEDDRNVLAFISADTAISRPIVTTPDAPRERVAALRRAFDATMKDPELLAEAQTSLMDITPESGEEAQKIAASIVDTPAGIVARAKALLGEQVGPQLSGEGRPRTLIRDGTRSLGARSAVGWSVPKPNTKHGAAVRVRVL